MALSRRIARPLLASVFVAGGIDTLRNQAAEEARARAVVGPASQRFSFVPDDPETLVRLNAVVQVGAGALLAIGRFRRLASFALICSIVPTTYADHRFWEETDRAAREQQRTAFVKNIGLLGGLILAAVDTEGRPSLGWRARRRGRQLETAVSLGRAATGTTAHRSARRAARASTRRAGRLGSVARDHTLDVLHHAGGADAARQLGGAVAQLAVQAGATGADVARQMKPAVVAAGTTGVHAARPVLASGAGLVGDALAGIGDHLPSVPRR